MKAFWTIVANQDVDGTNKPDIPAALTSVRYINPGDLWILPASGSGAANHRHLLVGSMAAPSWQVASKHTHVAFKRGAFSYQRLIHESQAQHTHPDPVLAYFMCFVTCSDADYAALTAAPYNIRAIAHADITQDGEGDEVVGDLETTAWTGAQRTAWETAALNNLGIALPSEIDRGNRLVAFLLEMALARRNDNERGLR